MNLFECNRCTEIVCCDLFDSRTDDTTGAEIFAADFIDILFILKPFEEIIERRHHVAFKEGVGFLYGTAVLLLLFFEERCRCEGGSSKAALISGFPNQNDVIADASCFLRG